MNIEEIRTYCLEKPLANESFPFGDQTLVFKVHDKIFALLGLEPPFSINLKCDPDRAIEFRETYPDVIIPGYHMNKKHWNTVKLDANLSADVITELIDHSFDLVFAKLPKKFRDQL
jgi:predicted DNA-binding protein (MmcQ/YjbR family)